MVDKGQGSNGVATRHPVLAPLASVSQREGNASLGERLVELQGWLCDDLADLEAAISAFVTLGREPGAHNGWRSAAHLLAIPGKRIRPMCVLLAARLGGVALTPTVRNLAVAVELVHAATLLHDDVIDEGTERRGLEAARVVYSNSASVLGGDQLFTEALQLVHETGEAAQLASLLRVISEMIAAEALQLERRGRFAPDRDSYLDVLRGKTAALFRWGLEAGGAVGGLDAAAIATLGQVGTELGIAFQLVDDIIDFAEDSGQTGKDALADLRQGKLTWPIIVACERDPKLREELVELVSSAGVTSEALEALCLGERVRETGALDETRAFARSRGEAAEALLMQLPRGRAREALETVIETAIQRAR